MPAAPTADRPRPKQRLDRRARHPRFWGISVQGPGGRLGLGALGSSGTIGVLSGGSGSADAFQAVTGPLVEVPEPIGLVSASLSSSFQRLDVAGPAVIDQAPLGD